MGNSYPTSQFGCITTINQVHVQYQSNTRQDNIIGLVRQIQRDIFLILERLIWNLYKICGLLDYIQETKKEVD
jgi:hypothetical protein